jgi:hypothetical protein
MYLVDQLGNEREGIVISDGPLIDMSVILDRVKLTILLFNEEEGSGIGTFRGTDISLFHMFLHELLQFFLFELGEGIDLSGYGTRGIRFEFDSMVPDSWFRETLGSLFAEDLVMSLVARQYGNGGCHHRRWDGPLDLRHEDWVSISVGRGGHVREEFCLNCIIAQYDNGQLRVIDPTFEPVDFWLDGGKPQVA